jgi:flagellar motor switch protein FliG
MAEKMKLTGPQKASLLLLSLGEDISSEVLRYLDESEIHQVTTLLSQVESLPPESVHYVYEEFCTGIGRTAALPSDRRDYLRKVLTKALGKDRAETIMKDVDKDGPTSSSSLATIRTLDAEMLVRFLSAEHPQVVALVLAHLEYSKAGEVLRGLPEEIQNDVVLRIARLENVDPNVILQVDKVLEEKIETTGVVRQTQKVGGIQSVAEILNQQSKSVERSILGFISENNPDMAEEIKQLMFTFEDLGMLDDRAIQLILRELSREAMTLAFRSASESVKNKFFRNMSSEAADMLKEDMDAMGPVRLRDVEKAQQEMVKTVRRLDEEGTIIIGRGGEDDVLI